MGWDVCDELGQVCLRAGSKTSLYAKHPSKDAVTPAAALHCKMHFQLLPSLGLVAPWSRINHPCCQYPVGGAGIPEDLWHISPSRAQPLPAPGFLGGCEGTLGEAAVLQVPVPGHSRLVNLWG